MHSALALLTGLVLTVACSQPAPPRNAVLVTLDTLRADALGCYGGPPLTPNLDALARESVLFESARSVAPLTLPAHASMLTGLYPLRHGVRDNGWSALPSKARTLAELAREADFETAAFVSAVVLDRRFGLDQGFDVYEQPERPLAQGNAHFAQRSGLDVVRDARRWLAGRERSRGFFLWVHLFDPHVPYAAPAEFTARAEGDPYLGEVAYVDHALGELLEALREDGTLERTTLLVVADHGESLREHGEATHGAFCYESVLRVPLLLRLPGAARAGERTRANASVVDVHTTLARALGLEPDVGLDGRDLLELDEDQPRAVYFECYAGWLAYGWSQLAGWTDGRAKYLHSSAPELYDLDADPRETRDLVDTDVATRERARRELARWSALPRLAPESADSAAPDLSSAIAALGYAGSGPGDEELPDPLSESSRPAPRERLEDLSLVGEVNRLVEERRLDEAAQRLRRLLESNPRHLLALDMLGFVLLELDEWDEAREVLRQRLARGSERAETWINLAVVEFNMGRTGEARRALERALQLDPRSPRATAMLTELPPGGG